MLREEAAATMERRGQKDKIRAQQHYEHMADLMGGETETGMALES